jgi:vacuolar-type H+-ATPase subunit I/STV1
MRTKMVVVLALAAMAATGCGASVTQDDLDQARREAADSAEELQAQVDEAEDLRHQDALRAEAALRQAEEDYQSELDVQLDAARDEAEAAAYLAELDAWTRDFNDQLDADYESGYGYGWND